MPAVQRTIAFIERCSLSERRSVESVNLCRHEAPGAFYSELYGTHIKGPQCLFGKAMWKRVWNHPHITRYGAYARSNFKGHQTDLKVEGTRPAVRSHMRGNTFGHRTQKVGQSCRGFVGLKVYTC